jgi:membrane-associated phospholipid phosphatase
MSNTVKARYVFIVLALYMISYVAIQFAITSGSYDLMTPFDTAIPFLPEWIWVYHSIIPVIFLTSFFLVKGRHLFFTMIWACIAATIVLNLFYIYLPSFYPRTEFEVATISEYLVELTRAIDKANNTFPSGHVTFAWLVFYAAYFSQLAGKYRIVKLAYLVWATMISLATLTLKQHYIVDVVSGIFLATLCFYSANILLKTYSFKIFKESGRNT